MKNKILLAIIAIITLSTISGVTAPVIFAVPAPKCTDAKPSDTPRIRKAYAKPDHIILYTTAVAENNSYYFISYGFRPVEQFGVQFDYGPTSGRWISYSVGALSPNTTYYFKIRGGNGCKVGNWSSWMKVTTPASGSKTFRF